MWLELATHVAAARLDAAGPHALSLAVEGGAIAVTIAAPDGRPAVWSGRHCALRYRTRGELSPAGAAEATHRLHELVADLSALDRLAAPGDGPAALVEDVDRLHRVLVGRNDQLPPIPGLPPCLDLTMRPPPPARGDHALPTHEPCAGCAAHGGCPATASPRAPQPGLAPLRHGDPRDGARAAVGALANALGGNDAPVALVDALYASRTGDLAAPHAPIELSLKASRGRLERRLRLVEYPPPPAGAPRAPRATRWRDRVLAHAEALAPRAAERLRDFAALLVDEQGAGVELSLGVDLDLTRSAPPRLQLYGHLEPRDPRSMARTLSRALGWLGVAPARSGAALALLSRPAKVMLLAAAVDEDGRTSGKAYFALPLAASDAATGLAPAAPGALGAFAPADGLAVLEIAGGEARFAKWDFPCLPHAARSGPLREAFVAALAPDERARATVLLDGSAFLAWPTWLSVRDGGQTLYFVPR